MEKIKVLMIGPGEGVTGGISTLVETIVPVLQGKVDSHQRIVDLYKQELDEVEVQ